MDFLRLLTCLDIQLCRFLGFSSPWVANTTKCVFNKFCFIFVYTVVLLSLYCIVPSYGMGFNFVAHVVRCSMMVAITSEVCVVVYGYNLHSGRFNRFVQDVFRKDDFTESDLIHSTGKEVFKSYFKELTLTIVNIIKLLFSVLVLVNRVSLMKYLIFIHRLVEVTLLLQWSLCVRRADKNISQAKRLMKTCLQQIVCSDRSKCSGPQPERHVAIEMEQLGKLENAVEIYRKATERRNRVNEYYGIYLLFYVFVTVTLVLVGAFTCWNKFAKSANQVSGYYILTLVITELVGVTVIGSICQLVDSEVR